MSLSSISTLILFGKRLYSTSIKMTELKVALLQLNVTNDKAKNLYNAEKFILKAKENLSQLVILPEIFNSPYSTKHFAEYAEEIPDGITCQKLSQLARENSIYIIGGSIPEKCGDKVYNSTTVWNQNGDLIAKHRKVHLFDIDIPGKIRFKESDALTPGNSFTTFEINKFKIGLGICYDIRFSEFAHVYRNKGCNLLIYPGAFNMTTGPLHWNLLARARANDNQCFVALVAPARDINAQYISYGHSLLVNPLGEIIATAEDNETIIYGTINSTLADEVRQNIPISKQRRPDLYNIVCNQE